jgi:hypothetical protein
MDELPFKIVKMHGAKDDVMARVENFLICKAAFEKALFVYPDAHLEMRQGAKPRRGRVWGLGGACNRTQKKCGTDDSPTLRTLQASEA